MKERCKAKAKATAKAKAKSKKQSGLLFFGLGVFLLVWPISFSVLVWPLFPFLYQWPGSQHGPVPTYVVSWSLLVVTQSGSDPAARHGSVPRTDAI
jgi:hypothetical protein